MRAALLAAVREPFVVEDIDYLDPAPGRVLIRTGASPFCSTDCVNWRGELFKIPPTILGHASMGEVVELGAGIDHIKVGDRVIVPGTSECGVCFYCSIGRPDQCSETFDRGGIWPHVANRRNGEPVSAAGNVGGYAEVMNVTASQVFPVQTDLPDEWLSLLGCGITTGVGCVHNVARVQAGSSVAIFGLGHLGQWMVQAARIANARQIIAVDPIAERRELAGRFGATDTVDPEAGDPVDAGQGAHARARRRLHDGGSDARIGVPPDDSGGSAGRNRGADQRRARQRRGDGPAAGAFGRGSGHPRRPERQRPHAPGPASVHPDDGGRLAGSPSRSSQRGTRSTGSTMRSTRPRRSAT